MSQGRANHVFVGEKVSEPEGSFTPGLFYFPEIKPFLSFVFNNFDRGSFRASAKAIPN